MKNNYFAYAALAVAAAASVALPAAAEDIDLYAGVNGSGGKPNVLFFIDNSSNWSTAQFNWTKAGATAKCNLMSGQPKADCTSYVDAVFGNLTELTQGQVELRALKLVLNKLICADGAKLQLNAGLMLHNPEGTVDTNGSSSGYIRLAVQGLPGNCATFIGVLDDMDAKITTPAYKGPSSTEYGAPLFEAFKYFGGWTNPAGVLTQTAGAPVGATGFGPIRHSRPIAQEDANAFADPSTRTTYKGPIDNGACGKNFLVLIGNQWPNAEWGANTNANPPTLTQFTRLGYVGADNKAVPQLYDAGNKSHIRFADEWTQFLYQTDVSPVEGHQNVRMFAVDVFNTTNSNSPSVPRQSTLLESMAMAGGGPGGYFKVDGDLYKLVLAFTDIMTKIAAVDSIFASPSLPVSVNSQGTFLNQVFMGLFRPDGDAQQRWLGNLKQYQFALDGNSLYLADSTIDGNTGKPRAAVSKTTGFLDSCATSFWTTDSGEYWKTLTGLNTPSSCVGTYPGSSFSDRPDGPMVERGGVAQQLRTASHGGRKIRTCSDLSCKNLLGSYATVGFDKVTLALSPVDGTLVDWLRGKNTGDGLQELATDGTGKYVTKYTGYGLPDGNTRPSIHGDVVHSRPLAVNYGADTTTDVVVYYGAGDGTLRAVAGNKSGGGQELWAFIAPEHWRKPNSSTPSPLDRVRTNDPIVSYPSVLPTLTPTPQPRSWFFDGAIGGYQERDSSGSAKVWIYATMRRGGSAVYAFDVTAKPGATDPKLMWKYSDLNHADMGQSWSVPTAIRIKGQDEPLVVFGAGYDKCEDDEDPYTKCSSNKGRGIVVMDAKEGHTVSARYRFFGVGSGLDNTAGRFVADLTTVDIDKDGYVDVLYAADTRGNLWRINTSNPANAYTGYAGGVADWPIVKVASVGQWGASLIERRKFMYGPSVVALAGQVTVLIGSGDREKPSDSSNAAKVKNRFYGFRDNVAIVANCAAGAPETATCFHPAVGHGTADGLMDVTNLSPIDPTEQAAYKGWFRDLSTTTEPYEQVVTTPLTLAGVTYFSTYRARDTNASNTCVNLGTGYGYQIDFQTGTRLAGEPLVDDFTTEGIPPSPVGGVVLMEDGKRVPFCIGCIGESVLDPKKIKPKVKPDRKPVYRYRRIDKS